MKSLDEQINNAIKEGNEFEFLNDFKKYYLDSSLMNVEVDRLCDFYNRLRDYSEDVYLCKYNTLMVFSKQVLKMSGYSNED